jgi:predicted dehydrogenase
MDDMNNIPDYNQENFEQSSSGGNKLSRRDALKGLLTVPVVGAMAYGVYKKEKYDKFLKENIQAHTRMSFEIPEPPAPSSTSGKKLRLGIIGFGGRGEHLLRAAGFAHPDVIDSWKLANIENPRDKRYEDYLGQEDLNVVVNGICDVFDIRAERALSASANTKRKGADGPFDEQAKRYRTYKELIASDDIDAVIIATPDHWHAQMAMDAAKAGKHVYVEKPMTRTIEETYKMREVVKNTGIILQLGHQGRQTESYIKAEEAIKKNVMGKITLVEVCTNRNDPIGAWVYPIHPEAGPHNIDWEQFTGNGPERDFSLERFFRWRCWWDYGTGLAGDLLTHEFDAINQIMNLGIPRSCVASGGIYFFKVKGKHYIKEVREVPDVFNATYEYPEKELSFLYSATLASQRDRGKVVMGHDAHMELGNNLMIYPDPRSTAYKEKIEQGIIDPGLPLYAYRPGLKSVDAVTSATEKYFAGRGLLYTYRGGKRVDTTHLHVKEWIDSIRKGIQPSCNIDQGFEEAITAHMATLSYRENRKVYWDRNNEVIEGHEKVREDVEKMELFNDVTL